MSRNSTHAQSTEAIRCPVAPMVELAGQLRDHTGWTWLHSGRVARYALAFGKELGLDRHTMLALHCASLLHDIGKVSVPAELLNKSGELTRDEWYAITKHSIASSIMLRAEEIAVQVVSTAQSHHEWYNGQGYPLGLAGEAIPVAARVLSIADAFDAMSSDRPYRAALSPAQILDEFEKGAGTQFDPVLVRRLGPVIANNPVEAAEPRVLRVVSDDVELYKELWFAAYPLGWELEAWPPAWSKGVPPAILRHAAEAAQPDLTVIDGRSARRAPQGLVESPAGKVLWIDPISELYTGVHRPLDLAVLLDHLDAGAHTGGAAPSSSETIRVLLADPYRLFRQALKLYLDRLPDISVVGEARAPSDFRKAAESVPHDIVIVASDLLSGTHSTAPLHVDDYRLEGEEAGARKPVIILVTDEDQEGVPGTNRADGDRVEQVYIYRGAPIEVMVDAVRALYKLSKARTSGGL